MAKLSKEGWIQRNMNAVVCFLALSTVSVSSSSSSWTSHGAAFVNPSHASQSRPTVAKVSKMSSTSAENEEENVGSAKITFSPLPSEISPSKEWKAQRISSGTLCEMTSSAVSSSNQLTRIVAAGSGTIEATTRDGETKKEKVGPGAMVQIEGKDAQLLWTVKEGKEMLILSPGEGPLGAVDTGKALALISFGFLLGFVFANT